ncbi:phosphoesterase, DHH family protein [Staphylococcus aureus]|nr:phosphoesterase, DHH family protein [Staphylococcus aureus]
MNRQSTKKALLIPFVIMIITAIVLMGVWFIFNSLIALIASIVLVVMIIVSIVLFRQALMKMDSYVDGLSAQISTTNNKAIKHLPIGIIVLDENDHIEWVNQFMTDHMEANVISESVNEVFPNILKQLDRVKSVEIEYNQYHFQVRYSENDHCLYFFDITEQVQTNELYENSKPIIATLFLDKIKSINGNVRFYGGKTDPMEKRTRVRARVISHALKDILAEGDKVIIMGHKRPDLDAIGAAIGVSRFAMMNNLEAYIVLNETDIDPTLRRVMNEIDKKPELRERFITSDDAWDMMTSKTTVVIVDTHKPELVLDENVLNKANRKVVIDHHRRGESFISNPLLIYMEPYASSTAELVTELLEYQPTEQRLTRLESTVMYAGIIVDTRNFTLRTGSRTFDAASYLRAHGADTILTQHFLKDDVDTYINRSELIRTVKVEDNGIAIAHGSDDKIYHPVTVAQAADELLSLEGIEASYVVARREDNLIGISARSLGSVNVQLTMEALGGGGHLTNAATQLKGVTVEEAIAQLQQAITEQLSRSEDA